MAARAGSSGPIQAVGFIGLVLRFEAQPFPLGRRRLLVTACAEDDALVLVEVPEHGGGVAGGLLVGEEEDRVGGGAAPAQLRVGEDRVVWVGQGGVALEAVSLLPEDLGARGAGVPQHVSEMLRQGDGQ